MAKNSCKLITSFAWFVVAVALAAFCPAVAFADLRVPNATPEALYQPTEAEEVAVQDSDFSIQETFNHFGIDVSEHQGTINWSAVAQTKVKFAIVRCGDGATYDDKRWAENVKGCLNANIPMGVYLYARATTTTAASQEAQHVIRQLQAANVTSSALSLPIYYDIEEADQKSASAATMKAVFDTFKSTLNAAGYGNVGLYASASVLTGSLSTISLHADYRWIACWNDVGPYYGYESLSSKGCGVWQYGPARVSGISGEVDGNYARSDFGFIGSSGSVKNMFRLYNPYTGEHFYTSNVTECGNLERAGWNYEGVAWKAPVSSGIPVFRLYNPYVAGGDHHYTTSSEEYNWLGTLGWRGEGTGWYSAWVDQVETYRLYNPNAVSGAHHYTQSASERDDLVSKGWSYEGRCWYGMK